MRSLSLSSSHVNIMGLSCRCFLTLVVWMYFRNVFSDDGTSKPSQAALLPVQASYPIFFRYINRLNWLFAYVYLKRLLNMFIEFPCNEAIGKVDTPYIV